MGEISETIKYISEYGILLVIAAAFVWDKITNGKVMLEILTELRTAAKTQADTLESIRRDAEARAAALASLQQSIMEIPYVIENHDTSVRSDIQRIADSVMGGRKV